MHLLAILGVVLLGYLLGSIPTGLIIVRLSTGKDIRSVESGRTGGTNAMRAAGIWAGVSTAILDLLKGAVAVWLSQALLPQNPFVHVASGIAAILGHNYSIFLIERNAKGQLRLRGGAGGAPTVGAAIGLWPFSLLIILPLGVLVLYFVGYASLATLSVAIGAILVFIFGAWIGAIPWEYVLYGVLAEILLIWALRPNIQRLRKGTERLVGFRARHKKVEGGIKSS